MKSKQEILDKIEQKEKHLKKLQLKHSNLSQIEMQSGEGSDVRHNISLTEGEIDALKWCLSYD